MMCQRIGRPPISTIGFGLLHGFLGEPGAESAGEDDGLHCWHHLRQGRHARAPQLAARHVALSRSTHLRAGTMPKQRRLVESPIELLPAVRAERHLAPDALEAPARLGLEGEPHRHVDRRNAERRGRNAWRTRPRTGPRARRRAAPSGRASCTSLSRHEPLQVLARRVERRVSASACAPRSVRQYSSGIDEVRRRDSRTRQEAATRAAARSRRCRPSAR